MFGVFSLIMSIRNYLRYGKNFTKTPDHFSVMCKVNYQGHTYVGWTCNLGSGLIHDPDCKCRNKIQ